VVFCLYQSEMLCLQIGNRLISGLFDIQICETNSLKLSHNIKAFNRIYCFNLPRNGVPIVIIMVGIYRVIFMQFSNILFYFDRYLRVLLTYFIVIILLNEVNTRVTLFKKKNWQLLGFIMWLVEFQFYCFR